MSDKTETQKIATNMIELRKGSIEHTLYMIRLALQKINQTGVVLSSSWLFRVLRRKTLMMYAEAAALLEITCRNLEEYQENLKKINLE